MNKFLGHVALAIMLGALPALAQQADQGTQSAMEARAPVKIGDLTLSGAFSRATLPRAPVGGGYLTIENRGGQDDRLLSVTAPVGTAVQIHEMAHKDGVMSMRELADGLPIPAGAKITLEPSGTHLMLTGLSEALVKGSSFDMILHFQKAGDVTVTFDILALNARHAVGQGGN